MAAQQQQQPDPNVVKELNDLRQVKARAEAEIPKLRAELAKAKEAGEAFEGEMSSAGARLREAEGERERMRAELSAAEDSNRSLQDRLARADKGAKEAAEERSRLAEENERLTDELASNVERPVAEGREEGGGRQNGVDGRHEEERLRRAAEDADAWQKKYQAIAQEKDSL